MFSNYLLISSPLHAIVALLFALPTPAIPVNFTIDDTQGDPRTRSRVIYTPPNAWNNGASCQACTARPDASQMYMGTWTDSTFNSAPGSNNYPNTVLSASVRFNGTAVYVYCALARTASSPSGNSDMTFLIDGSVADAFNKAPPNTEGYDYHHLVFSRDGLAPTEHTLEIQNGHVDKQKSLLILDSIVYTYDDGIIASSDEPLAPGTSPKIPVTTIIAAVVASIVSVALIGLAIFLFRRYRRPKLLSRQSILEGEFSPPHTAVAVQPRNSRNSELRNVAQILPTICAQTSSPIISRPPGRHSQHSRPTRRVYPSSGPSSPLPSTPHRSHLSSGRRHDTPPSVTVSSTSGSRVNDAPPAYDFVEGAPGLTSSGRRRDRKV
ncbi:hypothetical protein HGRIS_007443 [Hohenbuehelia grisea]|uniref:Uncharacterized protein n=1 Tax=Hohenbuehelia grisea TaxID=104357 RepID=A0ABR3J580_9AGAR